MHRNIKLLAAFNFFCDFRLYSAVLIIYFARITGSYALAMTLFSVTMISSSLFEIPTGIYSDLIGRKRTIMFGALASILATVFYAIGQTYWILFIGALFEGIARSWYSGNNDALLHDSLAESNDQENYAHYLGKVSSMFQLALAMAAVLGSILAQWSFPLIMWLSVIPQVICFGISLALIEPKSHTRESGNVFAHLTESFRLFIKHPTLRLVSLQSIIGFGIGESTFQFNSAFIATLWPIWAIGISKMLSFLGGMVSFWYSGALIKRFGSYQLLFFPSLYNRVVGFISVLFPSPLSPILISSKSLSYGVGTIAENELLQKLFSDKQRATMGSFNSLFGSMFYGLYSIAIGRIADISSPARALLFSEICLLSVIGITWYLWKKNRARI